MNDTNGSKHLAWLIPLLGVAVVAGGMQYQVRALAHLPEVVAVNTEKVEAAHKELDRRMLAVDSIMVIEAGVKHNTQQLNEVKTAIRDLTVEVRGMR